MSERLCSAEGCERRMIARGLCAHHYDRARFAGTLGEHPVEVRTRQVQCAVEGCDGVARGRHCAMHRSRLERTGSLDRQPKTQPDYVARFWSRVERRGDGECWPFRGTILNTGYGQFRTANARRVIAHRYAYELAIGPIPDGMSIDHVRVRGCGGGSCVNPAHLEVVTPSENTRRRWEWEKRSRQESA